MTPRTIRRKRKLQCLLAAALTAAVALVAYARPEVKRVSIQGLRFKPMILTIDQGTTIVWTNNDHTSHTATAFGWRKNKPAPGTWNSGPLNPGQSYRRKFNRPGNYGYYCMVHPYMTGIIKVRKR